MGIIKISKCLIIFSLKFIRIYIKLLHNTITSLLRIKRNYNNYKILIKEYNQVFYNKVIIYLVESKTTFNKNDKFGSLAGSINKVFAFKIILSLIYIKNN